MATYVNDLRLKEITTGDESGTWGTSTNTNLELIGEALAYGTQDCFSSDADATTTVADGATDPARSMYFKVTSSATLSATRTLSIAPNTVSRVMFIENATTGSQSIAISQGSGANVTIATGKTKIVYLDGAGSGAAVVDALGVIEDLLKTGTNASLTQLNITAQGDLRLEDSSGGQYVALQAASTVSSNVTFTLPSADGSANQVIKTDGSGALSFASVVLPSTDVSFTQVDITAQGDLRLQDTTGGQYVALQAPSTVSSSVTFTLPGADGSASQVIKTDGSGNLGFLSAAELATNVSFTQVDVTAQGDLRLQDGSGGEYVALQAPSTVSSNVTFTLPGADGSSGQVLKTDGSGALGWVSVNTPGGAAEFTQVDITAQGDLRLQDSSGGQYVALQAPSTVSSSYTYTLPGADGSSGQFLTTNGSGTLSWGASTLADDAVTTAKIADDAVTTAKIATDAVTQAKIADDAVGADQLASSAVVTASIVDDAVTTAKIADDAITSALIADDAVVAAAIADNSVDIARLNVTDGSSGQALTTNGSGTLSFATVGGAYNAWSIKTSAYTASSKDQLIVNSGSAVTITLPSSPSAGDTVIICNAGAGAVTVGRNSSNINSAAEDGTINQNGSAQLVYVDGTIGWFVI